MKIKEIYTIGHSTRKVNEFIEILKFYKIEVLVDVRRFPVSTKNPQFKKENIKDSVEKHGIFYIWRGEGLGGFRKEGYPEYTKSKVYKNEINFLISLSKKKEFV